MIPSLLLAIAITGQHQIGPGLPYGYYYPPSYRARPYVYRDGRYYRYNTGSVDGRPYYNGGNPYRYPNYYAPSYRYKPPVYRDGRYYRRTPVYVDGRRVR